ncbi:MAG: aldolase catalytic domain-containing protein [Enterocloster aldenensis]|nr:aldolase catalytic domain-containing protein [Enterocloster aldenensis]MDY4529412.1 aldolase catalytic domain-containing protein [Enterocloster aldenensis]
MAHYDLNLLDCTLRDGGYVNDWQWGFQRAKEIIQSLVRADINVVEVGFLRNVDVYNPDITVCNHIEELNKLLPNHSGNTMFSAMAMRSNYDIKKLSPYSGTGIEMIRITAHDYDIADGMDFAREVKAKGYKLSINPINIMGYSDDRILWILKQVNKIQPYQFSIVDTFGSMKRRDLDRIVSLVDNNLDRNIRVALHLHENMSLSCCLAQNFVDKHLNRPVAIDGSLMGMGRIPGNLPIELIADYLNEYADKAYNIDYLMDAIQDYIAPIKQEAEWGYTPAYFLSARFNLHRNYAEHYLNKGDLTNRDINHILARFDNDKKTVFNAEYADRLYEEYKNNQIQDNTSRALLLEKLQWKSVLVMAPGSSIITHNEQINKFITSVNPVIIAVNFIPDNYRIDFAFFSNNKRFSKISNVNCKTIVTSNIIEGQADFKVDYNSLSGAFDQGCNSFIMLLKFLKDMEVKSITAVGADGYSESDNNYYSSSIRSYTAHGIKFNLAVANAIRSLDISVDFLTPSAYDI